MSKENEVYFSRYKMEQNSFSNDSKPRKTPREIKRHLRVRFKNRSVIEEEAKFDPESSAEKPRKTLDEIKRHLRVKFTSSKKSMAKQKDSEFGPGPQIKEPRRSRKDIKMHLRVKYIASKNKSNQTDWESG